MSFTVTANGKYWLFKAGWTPSITQAKLYTTGDVLVNTQAVTFVFNSGDSSIRPNADIVFSVAAGTQDVSKVQLTRSDGTVLATQLLDGEYDFPTAGDLTIDSWILTITESTGIAFPSLTVDGVTSKERLWTMGWDTSNKYVGIYILVNSVLQQIAVTGAKNFTVNGTTGRFEQDDTIEVSFAGATDQIRYISLQTTTASTSRYYLKTLSASYQFTNPGVLIIEDFDVWLA